MKFYIIPVFSLLCSIANAEDLPSVEGKTFWTYGEFDRRFQVDFQANGKCTYYKKDLHEKNTLNACKWKQDKETVTFLNADWTLEKKEGGLSISKVKEIKTKFVEMHPKQASYEGRVYVYEKKGKNKLTFKLLPQGECLFLSEGPIESTTTNNCYWEYAQTPEGDYIVSWAKSNRDMNKVLEDGKKLLADGGPETYKLLK